MGKRWRRRPSQREGIALFAVLTVAFAPGCRDVARFSTAPNESYCGGVVTAPMSNAASVTTSRCASRSTPTRSTARRANIHQRFSSSSKPPCAPSPSSRRSFVDLQFRRRARPNLLYAADPSDPSHGPTIMVVLSLMHTGDAEMRLLRGAPPSSTAASPPSPSNGDPLFGLFAPLRREVGQCSF